MVFAYGILIMGFFLVRKKSKPYVKIEMALIDLKTRVMLR